MSTTVKEYLKAMKLEQREAHVSPTQAPPLFSDKLRVLVTEIRRQIISLGDDAPFAKIYVLKRDLAFYLISWWASDRAGDLGRMMAVEISRLPNGYLMLNHTVGKTVRRAQGDLVVIPNLPEDLVMDPVLALDELVGFMRLHRLNPVTNYVFRTLRRPAHTSLTDNPFLSDDATRRLRVYFSQLGFPATAFTGHSNRSGSATTLLLLGVSKERVKAHVRWATDQMLVHYTRVEDVMGLSATVSVLRDSVVQPSQGSSRSDEVAQQYEFLNSAAGAIPAYD